MHQDANQSVTASRRCLVAQKCRSAGRKASDWSKESKEQGVKEARIKETPVSTAANSASILLMPRDVLHQRDCYHLSSCSVTSGVETPLHSRPPIASLAGRAKGQNRGVDEAVPACMGLEANGTHLHLQYCTMLSSWPSRKTTLLLQSLSAAFRTCSSFCSIPCQLAVLMQEPSFSSQAPVPASLRRSTASSLACSHRKVKKAMVPSGCADLIGVTVLHTIQYGSNALGDLTFVKSRASKRASRTQNSPISKPLKHTRTHVKRVLCKEQDEQLSSTFSTALHFFRR